MPDNPNEFELRFESADNSVWFGVGVYVAIGIGFTTLFLMISTDEGTVGKLEFLVKNGDPPALLGRHAKFDSTRSLIVTPECEPPSITLRRNYENSKQFKSYPLGV